MQTGWRLIASKIHQALLIIFITALVHKLLQDLDNLYCCTVHLDINVYVYKLMHIYISLREC